MENIGVSDKYKASVFWSFNDELKEEYLEKQLSDILKSGLLGGFMHSRVGLVTEYMSEDWLDKIRFCCEKAREMKTDLWLYDEDRWPSGYGGGKVLEKNPELKGKALCLIPESDRIFSQIRKIIKEVTVDNNNYIIALCELKSGNAWYAGGCYTDLLNPEATDTFIEVTHEKYKTKIGSYFGREIKGIFSDEFCYTQKAHFPYFNLPFTDGLEELFSKEKKYSLSDCIEKLFFDLNGYETVRFDFFDVVTRLFIESYTKRCQNWCRDNKLIFTGHLMSEDTLTGQTEWIGAAMPHYAYMDMPGIDKLGLLKNQTVTVKQVTSVAEQLKKRSLCEALGCIGHQSGPEAMKELTDWLNVLGISFINPHLTLYSMRGERKRDYPPNISSLQPWFENGKGYFDHVARVSRFADEGNPVVDLLVLHPISSLWSEFSPLHKPNPTFSIWSPKNEYARVNYFKEQELFEKPFFDLTDKLLESGISFHYGDELIMKEHAFFDSRTGLNIGVCQYNTVIVPQSRLIRQSTLTLLRQIADKSGKESVIFVEAFPTFVDNQKSDFDFEGSFTLVNDNKQAVAAAAKRKVKTVDVIDSYTRQTAGKILCSHRKTSGSEGVFLCNTSGKDCTVSVKIPFKEQPYAVDTITGEILSIPVNGISGDYTLEVRFKAGGSLLLITGLSSGRKASFLQSGVSFEGEYRTVTAFTPDVHKTAPNLLPIDRVDFETADKKYYNAPLESLWHTEFYKLKNGTEFSAVYSFLIEKMPSKPIYAVVEMARNLDEILVNGQKAEIVRTELNEHCFDFSFDKIALLNLQVGVNTITMKGKKCNNIIGVGNHEKVMSGEIHKPTELETVYISGDFTVIPSESGRFAIYGDESKLTGNVKRGGLPFYCGSLTTEFDLPEDKADKIEVQADALSVRLTVNENHVQDAYLSPYEFDLTGLLQAGKNHIKIEAFGSLANTFGPVHLEDREKLPMIGPMLIADMSRYAETPNLFDFGIYSVSMKSRREI